MVNRKFTIGILPQHRNAETLLKIISIMEAIAAVHKTRYSVEDTEITFYGDFKSMLALMRALSGAGYLD